MSLRRVGPPRPRLFVSFGELAAPQTLAEFLVLQRRGGTLYHSASIRAAEQVIWDRAPTGFDWSELLSRGEQDGQLERSVMLVH